MDEVDKIILSSLNEIGYVTKQNVTNLKLYTFDQLVSMVICCLKAIRPEMAFPPSLPPTMSARYKICAQFAQICKELGYKKDIGYHTFMYQNTSDIRQVLIFLVEHLPKKTSFEQPDESTTRDITIRERISEELKNILAAKGSESEPSGICKTPFLSAFLETGTLLPNQKIDCKPLEWRDFVAQELPFIDEQLTDNRCFLPSVIALNSRGLVNPTKPKCSKFKSSSVNSNFFRTPTASGSSYLLEIPCNDSVPDANEMQLPQHLDKQKIHETTIVETDQVVPLSQSVSQPEENEVVIGLEKEIDEVKLHIATLNAKLNEITENNNSLKKKLKEKISHESSLQQSIALLPESEDNIPKLEAANEKCRAKILKLESQWKRHKSLLLTRRTELQNLVDQKMIEKNKLIKNITDLRRELFDITEEIQKKSLVEQRLSEFEVNDGVQRSEYITRILEIIKNLEKQRKQIEKILEDMRSLQKEINNLSGKVGRSFAVVEKLLINQPHFAEELSRETHRLIVILHKDVNDILNLIEETGKFSREIKDLEDQLMENGNHVEDALKQVTGDLARLKDEQNSLVSQIKKYTGLDEVDNESLNNSASIPDSEKSAVTPTTSNSALNKEAKSTESGCRRKKIRPKDSEPRLEIIMPLFSTPVADSSSEESDLEDNDNTSASAPTENSDTRVTASRLVPSERVSVSSSCQIPQAVPVSDDGS